MQLRSVSGSKCDRRQQEDDAQSEQEAFGEIESIGMRPNESAENDSE